MRAWTMTAALAAAASVVVLLSLPCECTHSGPEPSVTPVQQKYLDADVVDTGLNTPEPPTYDPWLEPPADALLTVYVDDRAELTCPGSLFRRRFEQSTRVVLDERELPTTCFVRVGDEQHAFQLYASGTLQCVTTSGELVCDRKHVGP